MLDTADNDLPLPEFGIRQLSQSQSLRTAALVSKAEEVIAQRSGDVLIKHTVLKADHFPSCHNTKLTPLMEGAPNFRKVEGLPVYGLAIPTVSGLRSVLTALGAGNGQRKVYWQNLREEPLVFINGSPFVVREQDQPFCNLEYTGINRTRVEDMEVRLKHDILHEAQRFGNQILVVHENEDLSMYDHWEPVTPSDVQTPQEVYAEFIADGFDVDYLRVPVTDEKAPKDSDFETLIQRLYTVPDDAALVFNCQMGRGRTTTGMIIASLLFLRRAKSFPADVATAAKNPEPPVSWFPNAASLAAAAVSVSDASAPAPDKLQAGMYGVVRSLLRVLEHGMQGKRALDSVIDACSAMQNLREAIGSYRQRFLKETRERQRNTLLNVCLEYLERYYMLICFSAYLTSPKFAPGKPKHVPFPKWMAQRAELRSILGRLLRRNSMAALELHMPLGISGGGAVTSSAALQAADDRNSRVIAARAGAVLGSSTILKKDDFPRMRSRKITQDIEGAPNFRGMIGVPVFGVGMPTVDGIVQVMRKVGGTAAAGKAVHALWINMREEPMVYINGCAFVLREEVRPLKNMMEYAGIDATRLEAMEDRLRADIIAEAAQYGGKVLVVHEPIEEGREGEMEDVWEKVDSADAVQTPAQVYAGLYGHGLAIKYVRVPVTDGTAPALADFDQIMQSILDFGLENPIVFNCQMGIGRTTAGMVIAGLIHMYSAGVLESVRAGSIVMSDLDLSALESEWAGGQVLAEYTTETRSPRSDHDDSDKEDEEKEPRMWELEPEQQAEQRSVAGGGYVGVRRVARLLEDGDNAKKSVDGVIDTVSDLINLRVAIMKYRKPRNSYKFMRPEMQQRHAMFKRGSAYLERYCLLIAFAFYLEHIGPETMLFSAWVATRPDLQQALDAIHHNPAAALAAVPVAKLPNLYHTDTEELSLDEQRRILNKRRGRTLTKRTILKSYVWIDPQPLLPEAPDLRKCDDLPVYSLGSIGCSGLEKVLDYLDAGPTGACQVVISDVREELVVYINGTPYIRRELEMPAAALHHAGIHAQQLEELEVLLREDVQDEVGNWSGRLLLHRELRSPLAELITGGSLYATGMNPNATSFVPPTRGRGSADGALDPAKLVASEAAVAAAAVSGGVASAPATPADALRPARSVCDLTGEAEAGALAAEEAELAGGPRDVVMGEASPAGTRRPEDDVTALPDAFPGTSVMPFWEAVDTDDDNSLQTPKEVSEQLAGRGYAVSYLRIPLSRERTPEAADLEVLHSQLLEQNNAAASTAAKAGTSRRLVHLILSRRATGSSARFVAAACGAYYLQQPTSADWQPASLAGRRSLTEIGEVRGIMSLARLLPGGFEAKQAIDSAIHKCSPIGNILLDIDRCRRRVAEATDPIEQVAARQLGMHYLRRYYMLVAWRCFLEQTGRDRTSFTTWMASQKELQHLAGTLDLES